jgi:hypothetical protein
LQAEKVNKLFKIKAIAASIVPANSPGDRLLPAARNNVAALSAVQSHRR